MKHAEDDNFIAQNFVGNSIVIKEQDTNVFYANLVLVSGFWKLAQSLGSIVDSRDNCRSRIGIIEGDVVKYVL